MSVSPVGLEAWEVVAYAALLAWAWLAITSAFSIALAAALFGRPAAVRHAVAPGAMPTPAAKPREPELASASHAAA
jgi:hypothetical protein